MQRGKRPLFIILSLILLLAIALSSCRPKEAAPHPEAAELMPGLEEGISAIASPIATLHIPPYLVRYRIRYVPPGWFFLGSDPEEDKLARGDETPQRNVSEPGYWIGESEVTNKEYAQCVEAGACTQPSLRDSGPTNHYGDSQYDEHPVVGVNWYQAAGYCEWADARLPTEAEWEKAARGDGGYIYPWGNDLPSCDRANANMKGCSEENNTKAVGSYPLGISPFGLFDMAGNVREWVADSYQSNSYQTLVSYNPSNSTESNKKVVRGGGFNDFEENIRTTARIGLDPNQDFDDVGFRCIPVTKSYATMCEPTYTTLCYDPDVPPPDEPCEPGQGVPSEEGLTFLGYGCPMNKVVNFQVNTNGGGNSGYTATVDGETFECQSSSAGADVLNCVGPETPMGTSVQIVVCAPGSSPTTFAAGEQLSFSNSGDILPVNFTTTGEVSLMMATTTNCPEGYVLDEATGACVRDQTQPECPDGWTYDRKNQQCVPNNEEEDCPETTTFSANLGGCQPDDGECPEGYYLTERQTCEPDQNRQGDCPPGYYFNAKINCCEPVPPDNYGCPDHYYFNANYQRCVPVDDNNCFYGTTYNGYGQCDQNPDQPGPNDQTGDDCPPGLLVTAANMCGQPEGGYDENNPEPGTLLRTGDQLTSDLQVETGGNDQGNCPDGYTYSPNLERCIQRDPNGCPQGYYLDENLKRCRPTNGPGSPCPQGYVFNYRINCCVPQPGMDGTRCPEDEPGTIQTNGQTTPAGVGSPNATTAGTPGDGMTPFANTSFDMLTGLCIEGGPSEGEDNQENPCPPGTFSANLTNCDQYPEDSEVPGTTEDPEDIKRRQADCPPDYWNPNTNTCDYPEPECGEYEYFDRRLGYCVPIQQDCCEAGQDYSANFGGCVPVYIEPTENGCPDGYELLRDGLCWLIGRTEGQGQCWTFAINTPRCVNGCEIGMVYNPLTGRCEKPVQEAKPSDPCAKVTCSRSNCPSNCCKWNDQKECVKK